MVHSILSNGNWKEKEQMKKLDRLVTYEEAKKKGLYKKLRIAVAETATATQLPLKIKMMMPPFKRLRRHGE